MINVNGLNSLNNVKLFSNWVMKQHPTSVSFVQETNVIHNNSKSLNEKWNVQR